MPLGLTQSKRISNYNPPPPPHSNFVCQHSNICAGRHYLFLFFGTWAKKVIDPCYKGLVSTRCQQGKSHGTLHDTVFHLNWTSIHTEQLHVLHYHVQKTVAQVGVALLWTN